MIISPTLMYLQPHEINSPLLPLLAVVGVLGREVGFVVIPPPAGLPLVGTTVEGLRDFRDILDMNVDEVFSVGFSVVIGCEGPGTKQG